ncbi:MAG: rhodanese-like domain-containing protein [Coriobacteriia bacterium]|nr:rhodanese-like domain-containing protein [Coriobacteriia bacterium]
MQKQIAVVFVVLTCIFTLSLTGCGETAGTSRDGNEMPIEAAAIATAQGLALGRYQLIDAHELKSRIDLGDIMIIIDVRPEDEFKSGHLPNAVNAEIPADEEADVDQLNAFIKLLPEGPESMIVIYDGYTGEGRSARAAIYAADATYINIWRFPGGTAAWLDADYKLVK